MTRAALIVLALASSSIAACGTDPQGDDTGPDAVAHQPVTMDVMPRCQTFTWEAKMGQIVRRRIVKSVATIDEVGPATSFSIEVCDPGIGSAFATPTCPAGMTCTGSTSPGTPRCAVSYRAGQFLDGKLLISCGTVEQQFDASGAETLHIEGHPDSIRLTIYQ